MKDTKSNESQLELLQLKQILGTALLSDLDKKGHPGYCLKRFMFCYYADRFTTAGVVQIAKFIDFQKEYVMRAIKKVNHLLDQKDPEVLELYLQSEWQVWEVFGERSEFDII